MVPGERKGRCLGVGKVPLEPTPLPFSRHVLSVSDLTTLCPECSVSNDRCNCTEVRRRQTWLD